MAGKRLEIHPAALSELKSAWSGTWREVSPPLRESVAEVDRAIAFIVESPKRWPAEEHATRRFILQRFPFAVTYREKDSGIQILAFAHGHRRPGYWKERL
jgi:plasmid stabilization system protein ParE